MDRALVADVWLASTDHPPVPIGELAAVLSPAEREHAAALRAPGLARRWSIARGLVRVVLGHAVGADPSTVEVGARAGGKPVAVAGLHWNASHSWPLVAIATSPAGAVGVDVERDRPLARLDGLCRRVLSPAESDAVRRSPHREGAFLDLWVRKEALLKATGEGLRRDLRAVRDGHGFDGAVWRVRTVDAGDGVHLAVAAAGELSVAGPRSIR